MPPPARQFGIWDALATPNKAGSHLQEYRQPASGGAVARAHPETRLRIGSARPLPADLAPPLRNRWFADSPLEGTGFEAPVPCWDRLWFWGSPTVAGIASASRRHHLRPRPGMSPASSVAPPLATRGDAQEAHMRVMITVRVSRGSNNATAENGIFRSSR
jgi:hypothetical protein